MTEYEVTTIVPSDRATSGEEYVVYIIEAESAEEAEEKAFEKPPVRRVERDLTVEHVTA